MAHTPLTPYQWRLFVFLSVATFFEGYDFMVFSRVLPHLRDYWDLTEGQAGLMSAVINIGTILAYLLVRQADRIGRRRTLTITIAGYTFFTFLTGFAPDPYTFTACQFVARIFLLAEWAISMVYAAEEFPADRRGMVIGVIQAFSTFGAIVCVAVMPALLATPWHWRSAYFVAIVPLAILAYARRNLRETRRFTEQVDAAERKQRGLAYIMRTPWRRRVFQMGLIWGLVYACSQTAVFFWTDFAMNERGWTDKEVSGALTIAALVAMPLVFLSGKLLDVIGRRPGALIIFVLGAAGTVGAYTLESHGALTAALVFAVFGASGYLPVLNAYNTELFPTDLRSDAFAWSNNLLGRIGYVVSPAVVGALATTYGYGSVVRWTAIFPLLSLALIFLLLPETRNRELEDTAAL